MESKIVFYQDEHGNSPIDDLFIRLQKDNRVLLAKMRKSIDLLRYKEYHKEPLSKYLEPGLWELRVQSGTNILRIIYTFSKGQIIILLHSFIKKQQKTPIKELEIARKRLREIKLKEMN